MDGKRQKLPRGIGPTLGEMITQGKNRIHEVGCQVEWKSQFLKMVVENLAYFPNFFGGVSADTRKIFGNSRQRRQWNGGEEEN